MTPTPKLRFVVRDLGYTKVQVLQQLWEADITDIISGKPQAEWRDVPVEVEK